MAYASEGLKFDTVGSYSSYSKSGLGIENWVPFLHNGYRHAMLLFCLLKVAQNWSMWSLIDDRLKYSCIK